MKSFINSIGIAVPKNCIDQSEAAEFMKSALNLGNDEARKLASLYKATNIKQRFSVLSDFNSKQESFKFFPQAASGPFPSVSARMKLYADEAPKLAFDAIDDCLKNYPEFDPQAITHLVTVSCTGMYAPGIDIEIIEKFKLNHSIQRTSVNFMGCYAAFNALKIANSICTSAINSKVLIVCVELCTIHLQKSKDPSNLLSNSLFGDGAAAVIIENQAGPRFSLAIESFYCDLSIEGKSEMAWQISDFGFEMTLSSYVPNLIKGGIRQLAQNLLRHIELEIEEVDLYAIHPGGRKILEVIEEELAIPKEKNRFSQKVLREFGNMSSPTVLFVLKEIFNSLKSVDHQKNILSFAFGPGLTLESMLLKVHHNVGTLQDYFDYQKKDIYIC